MKRLIIIVFLLVFNWAFAQNANEEQSLHLDWLDNTVNLKEDFYQYANGTWLKQNPIPDDEPKWAHFKVMEKATNLKLKQILEDLKSKINEFSPNSVQYKLAAFYLSGLNKDKIEKDGFEPIKPILAQIDSISYKQDLYLIIGTLQKAGVQVPFVINSMQDFYHNENVIAYIMQGGLGLPDRDYYLEDNDDFKKIRSAYENHIQTIFTLINAAEPKKAVTDVLLIENALAKASLRQHQQRDPAVIYHPTLINNIYKDYKNLNWQKYFANIELPDSNTINNATPKFFKTLDKLFATVSLETWKNYLKFHVVNSYAWYLSDDFHTEAFNFKKLFTGTPKEKVYEDQIVDVVNDQMSFALGKIYVERYFSNEDKQKATDLVENVARAFAEIIKNQTWMQPKTQQAALSKLIHMKKEVGYPNSWPNYDNLEIKPDDYVANVIAANTWQLAHELQKIGKPVNADEWSMPPQAINAYYDPSKNSLSILAGILQAPFFDPNGSLPANYGGIGFVIGHEITHGFDDQGAKFDAKGNLNNWWSDADKKAFKKATECIEKQFSGYTVNGNTYLQGKLVVGEATADLGGASTALLALQSLPQYSTLSNVGGFTPNQQFFISLAHIWGQNIRPELEKTYVTLDPHPPAKYRVNGTLKNMMEYYYTYDIPIVSPPCSIWTNDLIIIVNKNQNNFVVTLPGNPTTGYAWSLEKFDNTLFQNTKNEYVPFKTGMMGSGGYFEFAFNVLPTKDYKPAILTFRYARPWENNKKHLPTGLVKNVYVFYQ